MFIHIVLKLTKLWYRVLASNDHVIWPSAWCGVISVFRDLPAIQSSYGVHLMCARTAMFVRSHMLTDSETFRDISLICHCVCGLCRRTWFLSTSHAVEVSEWKHFLSCLITCTTTVPPDLICTCTPTPTVVSTWCFAIFRHGETYFSCNNTCPLTILHF